MLFDLQGKRRRVVQATYLMLAVLMGGGLVLFGIGGDVSGGLFNAFSDGAGGGTGNEVVEERVERNEQRIEEKPRAEAPRKELVRDYYQLAVAQTPDSATTFPPDAQEDLRHAATHWDAYLELEQDDPDPSLARVALQLFDSTALNQPAQALKAARVVAAEGKDVSSYLLLTQYAAQAGDDRTRKLAAQKALDLAPQGQRKAVKDQIEQVTGAAIAQREGIDTGGGGAAGGASQP
ncbi:MAG TPA: hypothetical protein VEX36_06390 [Thermoleophilaceae bacterium]|nr:hypothetical protein [Thermoleophilaceae bacterium]